MKGMLELMDDNCLLHSMQQVRITGRSFWVHIDVPVVMRLGKSDSLGVAIDIQMFGQGKLMFFGLKGILVTLDMDDHNC